MTLLAAAIDEVLDRIDRLPPPPNFTRYYLDDGTPILVSDRGAAYYDGVPAHLLGEPSAAHYANASH